MSSVRVSLALCLALVACGDDNNGDQSQEREPSTAGDGDGDGDVGGQDAGAQPALDASAPARDAGVSPAVDAATPRDAGATRPADAGTRDGGVVGRDAATAAPAPTFQQVYAIISSKCSPCHTSEGDGNLDMSTRAKAFTDLVGQAAAGPSCGGNGRVRVIPSDAEGSLLVQKLEGTQDCGSRMPRGRTPLPAASIDLIKAWITAGAKND